MKLIRITLFSLAIILLTACNFTLAEDVTPPPGYVPPTPAPTMGPLFPAQAPNVENGAAIFAEKCAPCHGTTGMGDGADGKQLPVTVPALALPEIARKASPAKWYTMVTQGNLERFMPPFASLNDQQRWDVISYALTLHTTKEQIENGKILYEANCTTCHSAGFSQEQLSNKAQDVIAALITKGHDQFPASKLNDAEAESVAAYLRTLAFAAPQPTATADPVTESTPASDAATPDGTEQTSAGLGSVRGSIDNQTGAAFPSDLKVTLRAYEHNADPNAGPVQLLELDAQVNADGTFLFENVEIPENRIFVADITLNDLALKSEYAIVKAGDTEINIPPIRAYAVTEDFSSVQFTDVTVVFDFSGDGKVQVFSVYSMLNTSDNIVLIKMQEGQEVPFIKFPTGSEGLGYEATQDSAAFLPTADGFAMPPSEGTYGLIAFATLPVDKKVEQLFVLPVNAVTILIPEGVLAESAQLTDNGLLDVQGSKFHGYSASNFKAGETLSFTLNGEPSIPVAEPQTSGVNQNLLIGVGVLGILLIVIGGWLYLRERNNANDEEEEVFESDEDIMDAIIALDDLQRAGKISDEAHKKRRAELKESLKR